MTFDSSDDDLISVPAIEKSLPPLPQQLRENLMSQHNLTQEVTIILVNEQKLLSYFKKVAAAKPSRSTKTISNLLVNEFMSICNKNKIDIDSCKIAPDQIGELVDMLESHYVNLNLSRMILQDMIETLKSPKIIADENNWKQITDDAEIQKICKEVLATESGKKMLKAYKLGKTKVLLAIAGEISRKTENKINMAKVMEILKELVSK